MNRLVVMKFGGTSVEDASAILRTARIVAGRVKKRVRPVVVVSAMAKVTDLLISAANTAARGDRASALAITERLRIRHKDTACQLAAKACGQDQPAPQDPEVLATHRWMDAEFDGLMRSCAAWPSSGNSRHASGTWSSPTASAFRAA